MQPTTSTWRSLVLHQLKVLLDSSPSYSTKEVQENLDLVDKYIVDVLGPYPTSPSAAWRSFVTDDHSPIEYSMTMKKNACTVRFVFEPVSTESGTVDPVNSVAPTQWISRFLKEGDGDLEWYKKLSDRLVITTAKNIPISPSASGLTQYTFGMDLKKTPMLKAYVYFDALVRQSSSSPSEWRQQKHRALTEALASIGFDRPWRKVLTYLDGLCKTSPEYSGQAELVAWDVVKPEKARAKIYVRFSKADLSHLLSHLDLGGTLRGEKHSEIQVAAKELWEIFMTGSDFVAGNVEEQSTRRTQGVILYYELKLGSDEPAAKFNFPVRHYYQSESQIAERFDAFLSDKGIAEPGWYSSLLSSYCTHRDLSSRTGLQTYVGCAIRNGEWEVSMYLSSEAYAHERWNRLY